MVNTCPTCSHPIRPGAKFCGYCGTDLTIASDGTSLENLQRDSISSRKSKAFRGTARHRDTFRVVTIIAIILLFLIILAAITWQYWTYIFPIASQLLPGLSLK